MLERIGSYSGSGCSGEKKLSCFEFSPLAPILNHNILEYADLSDYSFDSHDAQWNHPTYLLDIHYQF